MIFFVGCGLGRVRICGEGRSGVGDEVIFSFVLWIWDGRKDIYFVIWCYGYGGGV